MAFPGESMITSHTASPNACILARPAGTNVEGTVRGVDTYDELVAKYYRKIFNTAFRILGEHASAEDALQETLLNIYRGLPRFRGESKISTWISRITVNVCLGILRRGKQKLFVELEEESARQIPVDKNPDNDPLEYATLGELRELIERAFLRMSRKQGVVVRLHDLEGNTIQEISQILDVPLGTVKSRLFYGRQEFKEIFNAMTEKSCPVTVH